MQVHAINGSCVLLQQEPNQSKNVIPANEPTMLKSTEIQNLLRPLLAVNDIDQNDRSLLTSTAAATAVAVPTVLTAQTNNRLPGISELLPWLYLCGAGVAVPHFIEQLGITCIVNAAPELPHTPLPATSDPLYYQVPVLDRGDVDLARYFDEVADMLEQVRQAPGGRAMVHCVAGVSRSATLCLAYLMKYGGMRLREAFEHVRRARPQIRPNVGFFRQLIEYERQLTGGAIPTVQFIFVESLAQEIPDVYEPEYRAMELFYQKHRHVKRR